MVRHGYRLAALRRGDLAEPAVAQRTRCHLYAHLLRFGIRLRVEVLHQQPNAL